MTTPSRPSRTSIDWPDVVRRLNAGEQQKGIAYEYGVRPVEIRYGAKAHGYVPPPRGPLVREPSGLGWHEIEPLILARLRSGDVPKRVADEFGVSHRVVAGVARKAGTSLLAIRQELRRAKLRPDVEAVRNGASIASIARSPMHKLLLGLECRRLGVRSKHSSYPSKYLQAARVADAPQPEASL